MAHFYADIQGNRSGRTCMGTPKSGIHGHIRGWNLGVDVRGYVDKETGKDYFMIYRTSGSNGGKSDKLITIVKRI